MNMTKAYRAELRALKKAEAKIERGFKLGSTHLYRKKLALEHEMDRYCAGFIARMKKLKRRRAILEGRLK